MPELRPILTLTVQRVSAGIVVAGMLAGLAVVLSGERAAPDDAARPREDPVRAAGSPVATVAPLVEVGAPALADPAPTRAPERRAPIQIEGRLQIGGEPFGGAYLRFQEVGAPLLCGASLFAGRETDDDGRFFQELWGPSTQSLQVFFYGLGYHAGTVTMDRTKFLEVDIPAGTVEGRIFDPSGAPVSGVEVRGESFGNPECAFRILTDAEGRYEMILPVGQYRIAAGGPAVRSGTLQDAARTPYGRAARSIDIADRARLANIDLDLPRSAVVEGRVLTEAGKPLANAHISTDRPGELGTLTDAHGAFVLHGLAPGPVSIEAIHSREMHIGHVRVRADEGMTKRIRLQVSRGSNLSIWLLDPDGRLVDRPMHLQLDFFDARGRQLFDRWTSYALGVVNFDPLEGPVGIPRVPPLSLGPFEPGIYFVEPHLGEPQTRGKRQRFEIVGYPEEEIQIEIPVVPSRG